MSVKHVKKYYDEVCNQYHEFVAELKDFQDLCNQGMVAPEVIEQAKKSIEPLKDNWEKLNYIIFLLNKPNKKSKQARYSKTNYPKQCKDETYVYQQNNEAIQNLNKLKDC